MSGRSARTSYDAWHAGLTANDDLATPWYRMLLRHIRPATDLAGKTVLEIGCGRGELTRWLSRSSPSPHAVIGADFSVTAVGKGKRQDRNGRAHWVSGDVLQIPFPDEAFDTVVSCETIEHVPDPRRALRELARVLKPGGRLYLTTPNYLNLSGLYRLSLTLRGRRFTEAGQPINQFMLLPRTVRDVERAGLEVLVVDGTEHYLPCLPGRPAIRLSWPERLAIGRYFAVQTLLVAVRRP